MGKKSKMSRLLYWIIGGIIIFFFVFVYITKYSLLYVPPVLQAGVDIVEGRVDLSLTTPDIISFERMFYSFIFTIIILAITFAIIWIYIKKYELKLGD